MNYDSDHYYIKRVCFLKVQQGQIWSVHANKCMEIYSTTLCIMSMCIMYVHSHAYVDIYMPRHNVT